MFAQIYLTAKLLYVVRLDSFLKKNFTNDSYQGVNFDVTYGYSQEMPLKRREEDKLLKTGGVPKPQNQPKIWLIIFLNLVSAFEE